MSDQKTALKCTIGIDVSKAFLDVYCHPLDLFWRFENTKNGHNKIISELNNMSVGCIVIEATGRYHKEVRRMLFEAGFSVSIVNPYRS